MLARKPRRQRARTGVACRPARQFQTPAAARPARRGNTETAVGTTGTVTDGQARDAGRVLLFLCVNVFRFFVAVFWGGGGGGGSGSDEWV